MELFKVVQDGKHSGNALLVDGRYYNLSGAEVSSALIDVPTTCRESKRVRWVAVEAKVRSGSVPAKAEPKAPKAPKAGAKPRSAAQLANDIRLGEAARARRLAKANGGESVPASVPTAAPVKSGADVAALADALDQAAELMKATAKVLRSL